MISILITIKDRQQYLDRQIKELSESLAKLNIPWEVLIYDDGSNPALELNNANPNFKLFRSNENIGLIAARNHLVNLAHPSFKFVLFLDDDIFIHNICEYITDGISEITAGYSCVSAPYINLPTHKYEKISTFRHIFDISSDDSNAVYFFGGTSIFLRADFLRAGGLEGNYYIYLEEEDLALKMFLQGMKIKIMYHKNYIAIHDQAPDKDFSDRRIYLLSNRLTFHYKFVSNALLRHILNALYLALYLVKFRSTSLIFNATSRAKATNRLIAPIHIKTSKLLRFLTRRYFNI